MTLREYFKSQDLSVERAVMVTVASDGFKLDRDHVLAVSCTGTGAADLGTAYVAGANAASVAEVTEVSEDYYREHAISWEDAKKAIFPVLAGADMHVVFHRGYTEKWLRWSLPELPWEFVDIVSIIKAREGNMEMPISVGSPAEFGNLLSAATRHIKGGYKMDEICARYIPGVDGDTDDAYLLGTTPKLERQVYRLRSLWAVLLDAHV